MEPITIFASAVGLIALCRLTFAAADFFGKGIYFKGDRPVKRDRWHCFFKTTDLLGPPKQQRPTVVTDESLEQRRRMQRQRPRLQAERNLR